MKPPPAARLRIKRGFAGTAASSHHAKVRVLSPVYLDDAPTDGLRHGYLQYAIDMGGSPLAAELLANFTLEDLDSGFSGSWYDNFGPSLFNAKAFQSGGSCGLRTVEMWNAKLQSHWTGPSFLAAQKERFNKAMELVSAATGRSPPPVVANGFANFQWPDGACQHSRASVCTTPQELKAAMEDEPGTAQEYPGKFVHGWISEGFFGHETLPNGCSCQFSYACGDISYNDADRWKSNVQAVAYAAQNNLQAWPIIAQAGCKSPSLEGQPVEVRDVFEHAGYASFLLAAEHRTGTVTFGINAFYRENRSSVSYAQVHPRYGWPLGNPAETHAPQDFEKYRASEQSFSYWRRFENGLVIYNPFTNGTDSNLKLPESYIDPLPNKTVTEVNVPPHTAHILLKSWNRDIVI